jgi:hypothetical protein
MIFRATLLALAAISSCLHTGCEMHPASKTVPGYAEKMKAKEEKEKQSVDYSEAVDPNAPSYFPAKKN